MKKIIVTLLAFGSIHSYANDKVNIQCSLDSNPNIKIIIETTPDSVFLADTGSGLKLDLSEQHDINIHAEDVSVTLKSNPDKDLLKVNLQKKSGHIFDKSGKEKTVTCL
jgi:hypothetical protein